MISVSVTSVSARSAGEEIDITFFVDGGEGNNERATFTVSSRQYLTLGVSKGESDTDTFDAVSYAAKVWSATKRGMMLLGYGASSQKAMKIKLVSKGFEQSVAEEAVDELVAMGLIDSVSDATAQARRSAAKLWGKKRIVAGLYEKGYSADEVAAAMNALEDMDVDFVANCRTLIERRYGGVPSDTAEKRKLFAALSRYGYSSAEIRSAFEGE